MSGKIFQLFIPEKFSFKEIVLQSEMEDQKLEKQDKNGKENQEDAQVVNLHHVVEEQKN